MNDFIYFDDSDILDEIEKEAPAIANQFRYVSKYGNFPVYRCYDSKYYPTPNDAYKDQLEAARKARKFIFLEYLTIQESDIFGEMFEVLRDCAKRGVEVRIIFDFFGSMVYLSPKFVRKMKDCKIQCRAFGKPGLNLVKFAMHRNHQKLMVVDNEIAFVGGYNIGDEYFGVTRPYGQWQDTGFSFRNEAVKTMTVTFLYMWNRIEKTDTDISKYIEVEGYHSEKTDGFIQPYYSDPYIDEPLAENIYLNILKAATKYVYIITPYLIPSNVMIRELSLAAKRGVDVRLIIPGIPDKKWLYKSTCSYFHCLAKDDVKIYKYTPGFCHAKQYLCDDRIAVVGSINMDVRSMRRDFETAVLVYKASAIKDIYEDFEKLFEESEDITMKYKSKDAAPSFLLKVITKIFSPLL